MNISKVLLYYFKIHLIIIIIIYTLEITSNYEESHKICMKLEQELLSLSYAEKELKELKNEHKILEENIKELKNENFDYQNEIEKLMKLKEINTNISNKSSALSEKMSLLLYQYETEKNKGKCLDSEITKMKYDNDVLSTLLSAMEERNANLDKQLENSSKCISDLTNENNLKDNEISNLREQCKVLHTKNKNANNRVETLESSLKELSDEFRALTEKDCKMFHSTLKEYESRLESSIIEKDTLISNINQLTKEKDEALALQSALSQLTEEMELKINQLEHDKRYKKIFEFNNNFIIIF
jgi:chromosome segregation ATPase